MTDTPDYIKELQLKLWLSKSPGERLYQFIIDNDVMLKGLIEAKRKLNIPLGELDTSKLISVKK
ncbi:MAG: hypothetical protein ABIR18_15630 [Chitinophagaceae bacterium]